jgi:regulator of replication initiation timing
VGLRLNEKGYTELGIRIDITDPASVEKEVAFAFRPGFVRTLALQPFVHFEEIRELKHGLTGQIETDEDYKQFLYMLENEDNQMPLVVFTHFRPGEKKPVPKMSIEDFVKSDQARSFLEFSGVRMPGMGMGMPVMPVASVPAAVEPPIMPFNADAFGRSAFAYARVYVLGDKYLEKFRTKVKKEFSPGDILVCGARKFRGGISVVPWPGDREEDQKKAYADALLLAQCWSKHKSPYSYGLVVFEAEARKMEQHVRVMELMNTGAMEEKEKISRLIYEMELLFNVIDDKDEDIKRLTEQKEAAFNQGVSFKDGENAALEAENDRLRKELAEKQEQINGMQNSYQQAKEITAALEQIRDIDTMPTDNEDVIRYFKTVYKDRLDFTERGEASAIKCDIKPEKLWITLYTVANRMVDVFRYTQSNLTEDDVMKATGFDISFREGSMTREQKDYMRLREDTYNGKTISVEPHVKLKNAKGKAAHQRLHFWYDPEMQRIVLGYLGDHLNSAATRYAKQR